jgi:hypothetical protein
MWRSRVVSRTDSSSLELIARYIKGEALRAGTLDTSMKYLHPESHPITSPTFFALYLAAGSPTRYDPGRWQRDLLRDLAADYGGYVEPAVALAELACRAIRDRDRDITERENEQGRERAELLDRAEHADSLRAAIEQTEGRNLALIDENAAKGAEIAHLNAQLTGLDTTLVSLYGKDLTRRGGTPTNGNASLDKPDSKPRRIKVDGETGIYTTGSGAYQIGYRDEDGRQIWETIGDDLDHARELRAERIENARAAVTT